MTWIYEKGSNNLVSYFTVSSLAEKFIKLTTNLKTHKKLLTNNN